MNTTTAMYYVLRCKKKGTPVKLLQDMFDVLVSAFLYFVQTLKN